MSGLFDEVAYATAQGIRVAWYMAHLYATRPLTGRRVSRDDGEGGGPTPSENGGRGPGQQRLMADMARLFASEFADAREGRVPWPRDHDGGLAGLIAGSRRYFSDLPEISRRRDAGRSDDLPAGDERAGLPDYYLRNFHYQTDGYLSEHSARLYDTQVEVLFGGTANAMRRRALAPVADFLRGRDQRRFALLDIACGTGRFLRLVKDAYPRLSVTGLDLSDAYLDETRRHLGSRSRSDIVCAGAEDMPFDDDRFDIATSIFLFHELPPDIRRAAAAEIARVIRPGGIFVLVDSLQFGDVDGYDPLLESFDRSFHEPFYRSYLDEDFAAMFAAHGLILREDEPAFLSKVMVFDKPA